MSACVSLRQLNISQACLSGKLYIIYVLYAVAVVEDEEEEEDEGRLYSPLVRTVHECPSLTAAGRVPCGVDWRIDE